MEVDVVIDCAGDVDAYRLDVSSISSVTISSCDTAGTVRDTFIEVVDSNGVLIGYNDDGCGLTSLRSHLDIDVSSVFDRIAVIVRPFYASTTGNFGLIVRSGECHKLR